MREPLRQVRALEGGPCVPFRNRPGAGAEGRRRCWRQVFRLGKTQTPLVPGWRRKNGARGAGRGSEPQGLSWVSCSAGSTPTAEGGHTERENQPSSGCSLGPQRREQAAGAAPRDTSCLQGALTGHRALVRRSGGWPLERWGRRGLLGDALAWVGFCVSASQWAAHPPPGSGSAWRGQVTARNPRPLVLSARLRLCAPGGSTTGPGNPWCCSQGLSAVLPGAGWSWHTAHLWRWPEARGCPADGKCGPAQPRSGTVHATRGVSSPQVPQHSLGAGQGSSQRGQGHARQATGGPGLGGRAGRTRCP